jgi:hypothetical protein
MRVFSRFELPLVRFGSCWVSLGQPPGGSVPAVVGCHNAADLSAYILGKDGQNVVFTI